MYGLINKAIRQMVVEQMGEEMWQKICSEAGAETEVYITMEQYPDSETYGLVGALSKVTDTPAADLLYEFGKYWISFAEQDHAYGEIMNISGHTFVEFLENLDLMHERIALSFQNLQQPSFKVEQENNLITVKYYSKREGLAPFVIGLFDGLADRFNEKIVVNHIAERDGESVPDIFEITRVQNE